jgi:predicted ATPase
MNNQYVVFTGGPGSGKSTVIEMLQRLGLVCSEEKGRKIIREEVERSGHALPWLDKTAFRDRMLDEELTAFDRHLGHEAPVFFDRGIIDTYGYSLLERLEVTDALLSACASHPYGGTVFIFPPWEGIFANDAERKQDFTEARRTHAAMQKAYREFGYEPTPVPCAPVEERIRFILNELGLEPPQSHWG